MDDNLKLLLDEIYQEFFIDNSIKNKIFYLCKIRRYKTKNKKEFNLKRELENILSRFNFITENYDENESEIYDKIIKDMEKKKIRVPSNFKNTMINYTPNFDDKYINKYEKKVEGNIVIIKYGKFYQKIPLILYNHIYNKLEYAENHTFNNFNIIKSGYNNPSVSSNINNGNNNEKRENYKKEILVLCVLLKYSKFFLQSGNFWSIPISIFDVIDIQLRTNGDGRTKDDIIELFGSPINTSSKRFCSLYFDIDKFYGSLGSFYEYIKPENFMRDKIYILNPPYIESMIIDTNKLIMERLKDTENITVLILNPNWDDIEIYGNLVESEYFKGRKSFDKYKFNVYSYYKMGEIKGNFEVQLILLSNSETYLDFEKICDTFELN